MPDDMAALHASSFDGPARWSAEGFRALLADHRVFAVTRPFAFLLGRVVVGEAELLTLAVAPDRRGQGTGRDLVTAFDAQARARTATEAFLEVSAANGPARALYGSAGWRDVGRRPGYYGGTDALILRKTL